MKKKLFIFQFEKGESYIVSSLDSRELYKSVFSSLKDFNDFINNSDFDVIDEIIVFQKEDIDNVR